MLEPEPPKPKTEKNNIQNIWGKQIEWKDLRFSQGSDPKDNILGEGREATVYSMELRGAPVAVRLLKGKRKDKDLKREIALLQALSTQHCDYVIQYYGGGWKDPEMFLVVDRASCPFKTFMEKFDVKYFGWTFYFQCFLHCALGLLHLEKCGVLHRDLSRDNLLARKFKEYSDWGCRLAEN